MPDVVTTMTRQELRVFLQDWFCGCGAPEDAAETLRQLLALHPLHSNREAFDARVPDDGLQYLLLYTLSHFDLTEHGGSVGGAWLSDKGKSVLAGLEHEKAADNYETLFETSCAHGVSIEEDCVECNPPKREA
jgi:hypothetical protein